MSSSSCRYAIRAVLGVMCCRSMLCHGVLKGAVVKKRVSSRKSDFFLTISSHVPFGVHARMTDSTDSTDSDAGTARLLAHAAIWKNDNKHSCPTL